MVVREVVDGHWQASEGCRNGLQTAFPAVLCSRKYLSWRYDGKMTCDSVSLLYCTKVSYISQTAFCYVSAEEPQPAVTLPNGWEISLGLGRVTAPVLVSKVR